MKPVNNVVIVGGGTSGWMCAADCEPLRDFIVLHYSAIQRRDTEFWRYLGKMEIPDTLASKLEIFRGSGRVATP